MSARDATSAPRGVLVTGATGLVGANTLRALLRSGASDPIFALSRAPERLPRDIAQHPRVRPLSGDVTAPGVGLDPDSRRRLAGRIGVVVHAAANTRFSQGLEEARTNNVVGTAHVVELACDWKPAPRFCLVSTAFVAGRRTGLIPEDEGSPDRGWVNAYERSKLEAEGVVRASGLDHVVCRPSTIVCDTPAGRVTQFNAVHRALRICHRSLVPMLPGTAETPVDVVPCDYVSRAIAELATRRDVPGTTYHLAAGSDALRLEELLDRTYAYWQAIDDRSRPPLRPVLTDLETYRLFEATVLETGEPELRSITRAMSHFVPQLALPKTFATSRVDGVLGYRPPPVRSYWAGVVRALTAWIPEAEGAGPRRSVA